MTHARVTFLGTGTSHGVPMIGCTCPTCQSTDPRDRRSRPSIHLRVDGGPSILVDTSTDLRNQAMDHRIARVDAVLFTVVLWATLRLPASGSGLPPGISGHAG